MMQNSSSHVLFNDLVEAHHYTDSEFSEYKFSIIDKIDSMKRPSSLYYEFLLCYQTLSVCISWKQKILPLKFMESNLNTDSSRIGLEYSDSLFNDFKGLMISNSEYCLFDGDNQKLDNWQYAVGIVQNYKNYILPGPIYNNDNHDTQYYELFLKVSIDDFQKSHSSFRCSSPIIFCFVIL